MVAFPPRRELPRSIPACVTLARGAARRAHLPPKAFACDRQHTPRPLTSLPLTAHGHLFLLQQAGLTTTFSDPLLEHWIQPLARHLFGPDWGGGSLDNHRSFTVAYAMGDGLDQELSTHFDNAEVTLNICLGEVEEKEGGEEGEEGRQTEEVVETAPPLGFRGGELIFYGRDARRWPASSAPQHVQNRVGDMQAAHAHTIGTGVLHLGCQLHRALPISRGKRCNLIVWARSTAFRRQHGCPMCGKTDGLAKGQVE